MVPIIRQFPRLEQKITLLALPNTRQGDEPVNASPAFTLRTVVPDHQPPSTESDSCSERSRQKSRI